MSNNVQKEDTVLNIEFVLLDCSPLKFALLSHCNEWQNKFTTLLKNMATERLKELTEFLKENAEKWVFICKTWYSFFVILFKKVLLWKPLNFASYNYN